MEESICYVIHPTREIPKWRSVFQFFIEPAAKKAGFECKLGLPMGAKGSPIDEIISPLIEAELVVADVTSCNDPAVFYLLGVRHARSNRTILVAQGESDILDDFRPYHSITYKPDLEAQPDFEKEFQRVIDRIRARPEEPDNPVLRYLQRDLALSEELQILRKQVEDLQRALADRAAEPRPAPRPAIKFKRVS